MKFWPLVWHNLWRRRVRTIFTLLSIVVTFLLFGLLMTIRGAFSMGVDVAGLDRLMVIHKTSLIMPLPVSYHARLEGLRGVEAVTHNSWFGGIYQQPSNFFAQIALEPEAYFAMYPEYRLPPEQMKAWLADRQGAVASKGLAERFDWKVGDRIPIQGTIFDNGRSGNTWEFNLVGLYDNSATSGMNSDAFFFRYDYLDEARSDDFGGLVGWYIVKVADPGRSREIAVAIDDMFANSSAETKTTTEKGFAEGFANQIGDVGSIMTAILAAVLFTILLVVGNTMAQAIRERTSELAVLKTLGFSNAAIVVLILAESLLLVGTGGLIGLALAWIIVQQGDPTGGFLPSFVLANRDIGLGLLVIAALAAAAALLPAAGAMRLRITDALRKV
jgi:putative ABC transport system permease protein